MSHLNTESTGADVYKPDHMFPTAVQRPAAASGIAGPEHKPQLVHSIHDRVTSVTPSLRKYSHSGADKELLNNPLNCRHGPHGNAPGNILAVASTQRASLYRSRSPARGRFFGNAAPRAQAGRRCTAGQSRPGGGPPRPEDHRPTVLLPAAQSTGRPPLPGETRSSSLLRAPR